MHLGSSQGQPSSLFVFREYIFSMQALSDVRAVKFHTVNSCSEQSIRNSTPAYEVDFLRFIPVPQKGTPYGHRFVDTLSLHAQAFFLTKNPITGFASPFDWQRQLCLPKSS